MAQVPLLAGAARSLLDGEVLVEEEGVAASASQAPTPALAAPCRKAPAWPGRGGPLLAQCDARNCRNRGAGVVREGNKSNQFGRAAVKDA